MEVVFQRFKVDWGVGGVSAMDICAFSICETYSVLVLHRSMVD